MARRSDAELLADYETKKRAVADRMARDEDPEIGRLRKLADQIVEMRERVAFTPSDADTLLAARLILRGEADARVNLFISTHDA